MRKWRFSGKKCLNCDFSTFWNFQFFHFLDLTVCYSANFQKLGKELVLNVYLCPILPSPDNNSIQTKWALYLRNATFSVGAWISGLMSERNSLITASDDIWKSLSTRFCDLFADKTQLGFRVWLDITLIYVKYENMNIIWKNNLILCSKYSTLHREMFTLSVSDAIQKLGTSPQPPPPIANFDVKMVPKNCANFVLNCAAIFKF